MLRRSALCLVLLFLLCGGMHRAGAQEAPVLRIGPPVAKAETAEGSGGQAAANQTCTEEPLEPGIRFGFGGNVTNTGDEESTGVTVTYTIDGMAEFVPGTENAEKGTWSTVSEQELVLSNFAIAPGEVVEVTFDIQSLGEGTATYRLQGVNDSGTFAEYVCDFIFGEPSPAGLSGLKWNDANGNGEIDNGEEGLSGWTIELDNGQSTTTNADGTYSFPDLEPGTYTVSEVGQSGWTQTFPGQGGSHTVTLESGDFAEGLNFGNELTNPGTITGVKWNDANGNTIIDEGEEDLEGWTIKLNTGQSTTTGPDGVYTFAGLAPGEYTVSEMTKAGWTQTFPGEGGSHTVTLGPGEEAFRSFGNRQDGLEVNKFFSAGLSSGFFTATFPLTPIGFSSILLGVRIDVTNTASEVAENVVVEDELSGELVPDSLFTNNSDENCTLNLTTVRCELGNLDPGHSISFSFAVSPEQVGTFVNTATATSSTVPGDEDSAEIEIYDPEANTEGAAEPAEQTIDKGAEGTVSVTTTNTSDDVLTVPVRFELGGGMVLIDAESPDAECAENDDGDAECVTDVEGGESFTTDLTFGATETGTYTISAHVGDYTIATSTVTVEEAGQLVVEKTVQSGFGFVSRADFTPAFESVSIGDSLDFFIDVENTSSEVAQNVIIEDELPAGFQPGSHSESCSTTLNVVRCEVGNLGPGEGTFVLVAAAPQEAGDFVNTATAASDNVPGSDDTAEVRVVDPQETIAATAEPDEQTADLGSQGSMTFTFDNVSESDVLISPSFRIEAGVDFSSIAASDGLCEDVDASKNGEAALRCVAVVDSSGSTQVDLGFEATAPGTHTIAVDIGDFTDAAISTVTVEDTVSLELCGQKFVDFDADGEHDDDEPGLGGVTVELLDESGSLIASTETGAEDRDGDDAIDPFEEQGRFCFEDLAPGTYTVREVTPLAFTQTFPSAPGTHTVELTGEAEPPPVLFGNAPVLDPPPEDVALDYGDLPDPRADVTCPPGVVCYPTLLGNAGPRHTIDSDGPHLGATVDADPNGQPDATATGDDTFDGSDDEDGLINHSIQADGSIQFEIEATVPAGATAYVDAWVDLDDDGLLDSIGPGVPPPPEHVLVRQPVVNGGNTLTTAPGLVDSEDQLGFTRIRISSTGVAFPSGPALDGEVEDYVLLGADFGDAPGAVDPNRPGFPGGYPTTLAQDGARHVASFNTRLGDHIDADDQVDGAFDAREDDDDQPQDDEDGIRFLDGFTEETDPDAGAHVGVVPGTTAEVLPLPSVDGKLDAWIDWNRDGDWEDAGEQIVASEDIGPQMTEDDALTVDVPADAAPGFTYARFRFSRLGGLAPAGAAPSGEVEDYLIRTADVLNVSVQMSFGDASGSQNYRLVALPGAVDLPLAQTLSGDPGVQWQAFWDDGSDADFLIPFDGSETFTFRPGRGFWLISTAPWAVDVTVDAMSPDGDSAATVPLHEGWNIVSNPLGQEVAWADVQAANAGALQALWAWDGAFAVTDTFRSAADGEAFYFLNDQGLDALKVPYAEMSSSAAVTASKRHGESPPVLALRAKSDHAPASEIQVGFTPDAQDGFDLHDQMAPPDRFETASLRLHAPVSPDAKRRQYLAHEWRPPDPTGHTFDVVLRGHPKEPIQLEATGVAAFVDREVVLINSHTGRAHDLHAKSSVSVRPERETSSFKLVMGTEAFVERERADVLPESVSLQPGYPNPFRERATLTYALPERSEVRLAIYDVLGRRVRVLAEGPVPAGVHQVQWDGRDGGGRPLASGLYFIRLEAGGQQQIRKITLVR